MDPALLQYLPQLAIALIGLLIRRELSRIDTTLAQLSAHSAGMNTRLTWLEAIQAAQQHRHPGPQQPPQPTTNN